MGVSWHLDSRNACVKEQKTEEKPSSRCKTGYCAVPQGGEGANSIILILEFFQSTVSSIFKNANRVKDDGQNTKTLLAKLATRHHEPIMEELDWTWHCMPNSTVLVKTKALSLCDEWKKKIPVRVNFTFTARKRWFKCVEVWSALHTTRWWSGSFKGLAHWANFPWIFRKTFDSH